MVGGNWTPISDEHVLIVDDEPRVARYLSETLDGPDYPYRVSVAQSGEEALEVLQVSPVDLLVTDLRMPGMDGMELMRWVQAFSPATRTILITAYGSDDVEAEAHRLEAYAYLTKPFSIADFRQAVEHALQDGIVSQPGFTILSAATFEEIMQQLDALRRDITAHSIVLADMQGQCIGDVGPSPEIDMATLLSLLAGSLSIDDELGRHFGDGEAGSPRYHQGEHFEIYWLPVGQDFFLVIIYDRRIQESRMGLVQLYMRRAIQGLIDTLAHAETAERPQPLDADFGASLMEELDALFDESATVTSTSGEAREGAADNGRVVSQGLTWEAPQAVDTDKETSVAAGELEPPRDLLNLDEAVARGIVSPNIGGERSQ